MGRAVGAKKSQSEFSEFEMKNIVLKLRFFELKLAKLENFVSTPVSRYFIEKVLKYWNLAFYYILFLWK